MQIDEALRYYMSYFALPGEGQQVDRIMEKFGERYYLDNPNCLFKSANAVYTLSYLLMMLQTSIHNP